MWPKTISDQIEEKIMEWSRKNKSQCSSLGIEFFDAWISLMKNNVPHQAGSSFLQ